MYLFLVIGFYEIAIIIQFIIQRFMTEQLKKKKSNVYSFVWPFSAAFARTQHSSATSSLQGGQSGTVTEATY